MCFFKGWHSHDSLHHESCPPRIYKLVEVPQGCHSHGLRQVFFINRPHLLRCSTKTKKNGRCKLTGAPCMSQSRRVTCFFLSPRLREIAGGGTL